MSVRDIEDIVKEEKSEEYEWDTNPIKRSIQYLFGNELSETSYRSLSPEEVKRVVREKFQKERLLEETSKYYKRSLRVLRSVDSRATVKDIILALGGYLID